MKTKIFSLNFFFNGEAYNLKMYKLVSLRDLIEFFNYKKNLVVIEYNGKITNPKNWSQIFIKFNDKIEILTIVGGG